MNKAILNRVGLNITDQSFIKPKDYEFQTLESELSFRRTADGLNVKNNSNVRVSSVKGNSVVWNQIVKTPTDSKEANGVHFISQGDGSIKVYTDDTGATEETNISSVAIYLIPNHKYVMLGCPQGGGSNSYYLYWTGFGKPDLGGGLIQTYSGSGAASYWSAVVKAGAIISQSSPLIFRPRAIDLTLMFGAGNEPTTIEEFYARKPKVADENAFNEGEVIHMEADAIKSVGVNQWDEEWELGGIGIHSGTLISSTTTIRSKNFCRIEEGLKYYATGVGSNYHIVLYDKDYNYVDKWIVTTNYRDNIVPEPKSKYFKIILSVDYGTTYNNDICINLSDPEINGNYFPYVKREQTLEIIKKYFPNGMKSAGTAHDEIRWNEQKQKWEAIKRIGEVDMGTLQWKYDDLTMHLNAIVQDLAIESNYYGRLEGVICSLYPADTQIEINTKAADKSIKRGQKIIYIRDSAYTDAASFKAAMQGVMLYYELAEPIVTEIEENFNLDYEVWNGGTELMITDTSSTPVLANIRYKVNKQN